MSNSFDDRYDSYARFTESLKHFLPRIVNIHKANCQSRLPYSFACLTGQHEDYVYCSQRKYLDRLKQLGNLWEFAMFSKTSDNVSTTKIGLREYPMFLNSIENILTSWGAKFIPTNRDLCIHSHQFLASLQTECFHTSSCFEIFTSTLNRGCFAVFIIKVMHYDCTSSNCQHLSYLNTR